MIIFRDKITSMVLTHNQINYFWRTNATYLDFKNSPFVKGVIDKKIAEDFLRLGAYLINEGRKLSNIIVSWDSQRRHEILAYPRLSNAYIALGSEYLMKGIFLQEGYAINKPLSRTNLNHPISLRGNRDKLSLEGVQELGYIATHIGSVIDFTEFDENQNKKEKNAKEEVRGQRFRGITEQVLSILEYMAQKAIGKTIKELAPTLKSNDYEQSTVEK